MVLQKAQVDPQPRCCHSATTLRSQTAYHQRATSQTKNSSYMLSSLFKKKAQKSVNHALLTLRYTK